MAACNDYLLRAYLPSLVRSRELDAYAAAEFGGRSRDWFRAQVTEPTLPRTAVRSRLVVALRRRWDGWGRAEPPEILHDADAPRVRVG